MISASPTGPATLSIEAWPAMPMAVSAHADPGVQVDLLDQAAFVVLAGLDALLGDVAEGAVLVERGDALLDGAGLPEAVGRAAGLEQLRLLEQLREDDVPRAHAHDDHDDQRAAGDEVT